MKLLIRLLINAAAIWVMAQLLSGVHLTSDVVGILVVALIFGLVNALIRPIVKLLSLPLTLITLGLFTFVINALMLLLTSWLAGDSLSLGATLGDRLLNAFLGSLIISLVSTVLSWLLPD